MEHLTLKIDGMSCGHCVARVEKALLARWPESRLEPSLTRISALVDLLGSPHRAMPVVQVAVVRGGVHPVIDVADIATTYDRRRIVGNHQLVVHAAVDPAEVGDEVYSGPAPIGQRVEQTNLHIGVGIEGGNDRIVGLVVGIVDEEPNPNPTVGRLEHVIEYDPAGGIAIPDVVLHIQALLGQVRQC